MKSKIERIAAVFVLGLLTSQTVHAQFGGGASFIVEERSELMKEAEKKMRALKDSGIARLNFYPRVSGSTSTVPIGELLLARALGLDGELRRNAPPAQNLFRPTYSVGFQIKPSQTGEAPKSEIGQTPLIISGRGRTKIAGDLLYDNEVVHVGPVQFGNPFASPLGRQTASALRISFPLGVPTSRLQEYSNLLSLNAHRETHGSYDALAKGIVDLILVAREPSAAELKLAEENKMAFESKPVALDALVFIANAKNTIDGLTLDQGRGIYSGRIKNWKEVGGADKSIYAITRNENSGSQELIAKLVMQNQPVIEGRNRMASSMAGTFDMTESNEDSIAYSVFYYERIMNPRATLKPLAIDGVLPTSKTIADRTYSLVEPVKVVTRKGIAPDSPTAILRDWLLSAEGQRLIAQSGYVPFSTR